MEDYLDFESFCSSHDISCSGCPLRGARIDHEDCKRMYSIALANNGKVTIDISSHMKERASRVREIKQ